MIIIMILVLFARSFRIFGSQPKTCDYRLILVKLARVQWHFESFHLIWFGIVYRDFWAKIEWLDPQNIASFKMKSNYMLHRE